MRKPRVLIIDDDPTIARIVRLTLQSKGYNAVVTETTHAGLKELFQEKTDLIFLDYMLPDQNGLSFLKDLRAEPELRKIPVIMMTTTGFTDVVQAAKILGANDFIGKPFNIETLLEKAMKLAPVLEKENGEEEASDEDTGETGENPTALSS
jgi:two-component system, OmpR family, phosphate regulon response regulator PhoB